MMKGEPIQIWISSFTIAQSKSSIITSQTFGFWLAIFNFLKLAIGKVLLH